MSLEVAPRLKEVSMDLVSFPRNRNNLEVIRAQQEFIESQSETLETLSLTMRSHNLYRDNDIDFPKLQFPVMEKLKTLTLRSVDQGHGNYSYAGYALGPIQPEQLPNLGVLNIDPIVLGTDVEVFNSIFPTVEEIYLGKWERGMYRRNIDIVPQVGAHFPNLKKLTNLEIHMNESYMESITEFSMRSIQDLELIILDDGNENLRKNFNWVISGASVENEWMLDQIARRVGRKVLLSWLCPYGDSLRDLIHAEGVKRLVISFNARNKEESVVHINDISVYLTFLRLPPELCLIFRGDFTIPEDLASMLTKHYKNVYFEPISTITSYESELESDSDSSMDSNSDSDDSEPDL